MQSDPMPGLAATTWNGLSPSAMTDAQMELEFVTSESRARWVDVSSRAFP